MPFFVLAALLSVRGLASILPCTFLILILTSFHIVYFLYPETSGVRLEDMDLLFGDASTAMPTPVTDGERGSLMGAGSPVPSLDIRRQYGQSAPFAVESAIPGLDIDRSSPSQTHEGISKPGLATSHQGGSRSEGIGGWISNIVGRQRRSTNQSQYRPLDQGDEEHER